MARILVVDDETQVCHVLDELLGQYEHEVATATSGPEAIAMLPDYQPELILLDILMPDMDGMEVLNHIKDWNPEIPVVILTGVDDENIAEQAIDAGARDYITKPILGDQLETVLLVYLLVK
mgnify:CR=1 FL=1